MDINPLMDDGYAGEPAKRVLNYTQRRKKNGDPVVGIYCGYAPIELIQAMGIVPAVLCAFSKVPIPAAETVLPANLCPLIKSSYGFIIEGTCPFYAMSEAVIAETTCDGKKKMVDRYLKIPCACMTPNQRRLEDLSEMIARFKPDAVVDFVLQACHSYNVESYKIGRHVEEVHGLPFLKVETDYADSDIGQLSTRIEALFESI